MWIRELHLFLESSRTSLPAQVPNPGLLHLPARAAAHVVDVVLCVDQACTSSVFLRLQHMLLWAGAARDGTEVLFFHVSVRHVVRPYARLVGNLIDTSVEEETAGWTECRCCENLGHRELRWARDALAALSLAFFEVFVGLEADSSASLRLEMLF